MVSLKYDCPSCLSENQGFEYRSYYQHPVSNQVVYTQGGNVRKATYLEYVTFSCGHCHEPVFAKVGNASSVSVSQRPVSLVPEYDDGTIFLLDVEPHRAVTDIAPESTPPNVAASFEQGCRALEKGDADLAGMGFRKSLDVGTRHLIRAINPPDLEKALKGTLDSRIKWLHSNGRLTDELKDWAHIIREDGNEAAHDEEPYSLDEAKQLHEFAKVFLIYLFTIPGMIAAKRPPQKP